MLTQTTPAALNPISVSTELPESLGEWPGAAIEFAICLNRIRRAVGDPVNDNRVAMESIKSTRAWWRVSTAHSWPTRNKRAEALESSIEPALLAIHRAKARMVRSAGGMRVQAPSLFDRDALKQALEALGIGHLELVEEGSGPNV